ncbi:acetyl-CoA hydrolase [Candidatus Binatia bacterium]|nr:acetyl-CoA hydrolase [Candidatus Binatia bacterium]
MSDLPRELATVEECVEWAIATVGNRIVLGAPLGLGKPNQLMNAFYRRACADPSLHLTIFTALSLEKPTPESDIEARLLEPYLSRHFGDYCDLEYLQAVRSDSLPPNVRVHEFYFRAGSMTRVAAAQRHYVSTNYTFVARDLLERGVNVLVQLVAEQDVDGRRMLSLSGNTDVTLDLVPMLEELRRQGRTFVTIAQVHRDLPFMYNRAMVEPRYFDFIVRNPAYNTTLFATPNLSVGTTDYAIGFHASTLVKDGGTLQIGIGALGDALVYGCLLRHRHNAAYREVAAGLGADPALVDRVGGLAPFEKGLYGCSEMFVNGFVQLLRAGILTRAVFDEPRLQRLLNEGRIATTVDNRTLATLAAERVISPQLTRADVDFLRYWGILRPEVGFDDGHLIVNGTRIRADLDDPEAYETVCEWALGDALAHGVVMHGGFFLGPADFYQALRDMPRAEAERIAMDSVRRINRIDQPDLQALQRTAARFVNTAMMVTLSGAVVSDGLEDGQVISGVGGQYNFVAQAHELPDARSIICLRAVRGTGRHAASNIVPSYGHCTVPRHLRDIVVTEYGVADLRARSDEEIVQALLNIADSRFQDDLLDAARNAGKIDPDYRVPERYRNNLPERVQGEIQRWRKAGHFPPFPFGTDFTADEIVLGATLKNVKAMMDEPRTLIRQLIRSFTHEVHEEEAGRYLQRIALEHPQTAKEVILQHLLLLELEERGHLRPL